MDLRRRLSTAGLVGALGAMAGIAAPIMELPIASPAPVNAAAVKEIYPCTHLAAPISRYKSINRGPNRADRRAHLRQRCKRGRVPSFLP